MEISGGSRISRRGKVNLLGGVDSRGGYVSKILYVETKESEPLGGVRRARPLDPSMLGFVGLFYFDLFLLMHFKFFILF